MTTVCVFENLLHGDCVVVVPVMLLMVHTWGKPWSNCHLEIPLPSKQFPKFPTATGNETNQVFPLVLSMAPNVFSNVHTDGLNQ